jgi:hypothetical protein
VAARQIEEQRPLGDEETASSTRTVPISRRDRLAALQSENVFLSEGDILEKLLLGSFITLSSVLMRERWFERLSGFGGRGNGGLGSLAALFDARRVHAALSGTVDTLSLGMPG